MSLVEAKQSMVGCSECRYIYNLGTLMYSVTPSGTAGKLANAPPLLCHSLGARAHG